MLEQQGLQLLAPLYEGLEGGSAHPQTEVEGETLDVDAVRTQQLDVRVVKETDAVQVDHLQVRGVRLDLTNVDNFIRVFFRLAGQLKRTYRQINRQTAQTYLQTDKQTDN